jgi:hypothetical protein
MLGAARCALGFDRSVQVGAWGVGWRWVFSERAQGAALYGECLQKKQRALHHAAGLEARAVPGLAPC